MYMMRQDRDARLSKSQKPEFPLSEQFFLFTSYFASRYERLLKTECQVGLDTLVAASCSLLPFSCLRQKTQAHTVNTSLQGIDLHRCTEQCIHNKPNNILEIFCFWKNYAVHSPVNHHSSVYNCFYIRTQWWLRGPFKSPYALFLRFPLHKYADRRSTPFAVGISVKMGHQVLLVVQCMKRSLKSYLFQSLFMIQNPSITDRMPLENLDMDILYQRQIKI